MRATVPWGNSISRVEGTVNLDILIITRKIVMIRIALSVMAQVSVIPALISIDLRQGGQRYYFPSC